MQVLWGFVFLFLLGCASSHNLPDIKPEILTDTQKRDEKSDLYFSIGESLYSHNRLIQATENFQEALSINPNNYKAHYRLGATLIERKFIEQGLSHIYKALSINKNYTEAKNYLIKYWIEKNRYEMAKRFADESARDLVYSNQEETWALKLKLDAYFNSKKEIEQTIARAISTPLRNCTMRTSIAKTLLKIGRAEEALTVARQADRLCRIPEDKSKLQYLKALIFYKKDDVLIADKMLDKINTRDESLRKKLIETRTAINKKLRNQ